MIRTYKYHLSCHIMLHQHVIGFFNRIEHEAGDFDNAFFDPEFLDIVNRHPQILRQRLQDIYSIFKRLRQSLRSAICEQIRRSNDIEEICAGSYRPVKLDNTVKGLRHLLRKFFIDLYDQVLDGRGFRDKYFTTLRDHFDGFSRTNSTITLCPICGIGELKKKQDECRDQYDHFLPKAFYPFSSVNFENLVPSCRECNSFDAKGEKDTIAESTGRLFFPFDNSHKGIKVEFHIQRDNTSIQDIQWQIAFINLDGKNDEITSWKNLYNIDSRYKGFIQARIEKWYRVYWEYLNDSDLVDLSEAVRVQCYMKTLEKDESLELSFVRKPALNCFLNESVLAQATIEARLYS